MQGRGGEQQSSESGCGLLMGRGERSSAAQSGVGFGCEQSSELCPWDARTNRSLHRDAFEQLKRLMALLQFL